MDITEKFSDIMVVIYKNLFDLKKGIMICLIACFSFLLFNMIFSLIFKDILIKEISWIPIDYRVYIIFHIIFSAILVSRYAYFRYMKKGIGKINILIMTIIILMAVIIINIYGTYPNFISQLSKFSFYYLSINFFLIILLTTYASILKAINDKEYNNVRT